MFVRAAAFLGSSSRAFRSATAASPNRPSFESAFPRLTCADAYLGLSRRASSNAVSACAVTSSIVLQKAEGVPRVG